MTTIQEDKAFMDAICENPFDVSPRQQYLDWLIEHEDPKAEFIDLQCNNMSLSTKVMKEWLIPFKDFLGEKYEYVYAYKYVEVFVVVNDRALIYRNGFVEASIISPYYKRTFTR